MTTENPQNLPVKLGSSLKDIRELRARADQKGYLRGFEAGRKFEREQARYAGMSPAEILEATKRE